MVLNQLVFRSYLAVNLLSCAQPIAERYSAHSAPFIIKRQMIDVMYKNFYIKTKFNGLHWTSIILKNQELYLLKNML